MTRKQFIATSSFLGFIPAAGLLAVLAFGVAGSASDFSLPMWGLYGTTFIAAIFTLASPVAIVLLIPKDAGVATLPPSPAEPSTEDSIDGEEELIGSSDTDGAFDEDAEFHEDEEESDDYDPGATEVASLDDDGFEDEFDDFDDDEDFT